jgi:hypothetical protein
VLPSVVVSRDRLTAAGTLADGMQLTKAFVKVDVDVLEVKLPGFNFPNAPFGQQSSLPRESQRQMSGSGYGGGSILSKDSDSRLVFLCVEQECAQAPQRDHFAKTMCSRSED